MAEQPKARSINSWVDFTEAFVRNFTSTYKRPHKPRQVSLCVQGPDESTRDYLTRWAELQNSCEGVHEVQAIEYFTVGAEKEPSSSTSSFATSQKPSTSC